MGTIFTQNWIKDAVENLCGSDLAKIKYLEFGESFDNDYYIKMSLETPPKPFVCTEGGDEWMFCLRQDDISPLLEKYKEKKDIQLSFDLDVEEDEKWSDYVWSDEAKTKWESFAQSITENHYYEQIEDYDEWNKWYENVRVNAWKDICLFKGIEVLKIQGLCIPDFGVFGQLPDLRCLELVETAFDSGKDISGLGKLEQLCCWMD